MDTTFTPPWTPPKKVEELYEKVVANNRFAAINRPTAGKRNEKELPVGDADMQLYSVSTPNGQKVGILLEELLLIYLKLIKKIQACCHPEIQ